MNSPTLKPMQLLETLPKSIFPEEIENWFGEFIGIIKADQFMLETGCAPQEKEDFYTDLITNNTDKIFSKKLYLTTYLN